jgi:hypothetical protein
MNARTCQLCGKPLSRLRVGVDGDFCSREHKSQYGLRLGMDRLHEADKVASLMRRRENPRQLGAARLMCNSASSARVCDSPKLLAARIMPAGLSPVFSVAGKPQMATEPQGYLQPRPTRLPGVSKTRRPDSSRIRITPRKTAPALRGHEVIMRARLAQARITALQTAPPETVAQPRRFDLLQHSKTRVELGNGLATLHNANALGKVSIHQTPRVFKLRTAPRKGNALRVSSGIGFRVPRAHLSEHASAPAMRSALVWPYQLHPTTPGSAASQAAPKSLQVGIRLPNVKRPAGPRPGRPARFLRANVVALAARRPAAGVKPPARFTGVQWNPQDPNWAGSLPGPASAGFARRNGAHLFALPVQAYAIDAVRQLASAPIHVQESPVGYPRVAIHDTLAGAILSPGNLAGTPGGLAPVGGGIADVEAEATPRVAAPVVVMRLEEHFDNGWGNWTGGTADWLLDVAGVRTGSLALYNPSMDQMDYELEFLARIDQRNVSWAVRAASQDEYCRCTLTAMPGGELEFSRSVVFEGTAQPQVTAALRIAAKPKSSLTVSTRVDGESYTVSVNGQTIDTWTDARLPIGGIGFMGSPEDRARLYWVRLSSSGSPAREYRKR